MCGFFLVLVVWFFAGGPCRNLFNRFLKVPCVTTENYVCNTRKTTEVRVFLLHFVTLVSRRAFQEGKLRCYSSAITEYQFDPKYHFKLLSTFKFPDDVID